MKSLSLNTAQLIATCPGCGLLCDDIVLEITNNQLKVINSNCAKTVAFFEQDLAENSPQINGEPATLQAAILKASQILKQAKNPIFTGLGTDVQGFRALYNLSQKTNANLSHMNAASMARNLKVLQSTGWQTTTLTEVKNRADLIVCFGSDLLSHNARFFERFVDTDGMFVSAKNRQVIVLGEASNQDASDALQSTWTLPCKATDLPSVTIALRALVAGKRLKATEVAGVQTSDLQTLADKLKAAKYAVLAWTAKDLDFPHAELTIQNITETVALLNNTTRAAGLPLGGSDGDTSANNANTWLSGWALNDGILNVEHAVHDAMLWVNSFTPEKMPPNTDKPLIILGNSNIKHRADVFIPIATPSLDCSGTLFRVDLSVVLPLKKVRASHLPTLAEVIGQIEAQLT
ncbi:MAG TPA: formylmethanofuran dehydrogenase [Methylotenera sp.]|nr:formylmethanofuran dehydrogenase [Methylotenera sp.]